LISTPYRNYIYTNKIEDFGLADVGNNIFAVTVISLISWIGAFKFSNNKIIDILIFTAIYIVLEILSYFFSIFGTFDYKDIIALLCGSFLAIVLLYLFEKENFHNNIKGLNK
tara:strand:- start:2305 stop:2640 length:336 start_codon:yes stop_codon:yes gene_type:complete